MEDSTIHIQAEFIIENGMIQEFRELIQGMSALVQSNEPGTLEYKFYLNDDEAKCVVHEAYLNSEAALHHNNGLASQTILPKIFNISRLNRLDVYGDLSKELHDVLKDFKSEHY